jgi:2-oxoglutarate ferredoxin oxidoreductase subunit alpha
LVDHNQDNQEDIREFISGAEAIARAAVDSGCDFFSGYPITPATPILLQMISELPKVGGIAIQAEDEISAIGFCIGAALAGSRVMTATSGPGISLYSENIGLAIMGEVPIVIVDCQRMGPATGGATTVAQGDVQFLRWGTSGGYPIIALSPTDVADCYRLTCYAFTLAEQYRVPVFVLTDKDTVLTKATVSHTLITGCNVDKRKTYRQKADFVPYRFENLEDVPVMSPFGNDHIVRFTTSSHDDRGYLSKDPDVVGRMNAHLAAKIDSKVEQIALIDADIQDGADTLFVSYGITSRSVKEAVRIARSHGHSVSALTVYSLWPVPEQQIRNAMKGIKKVMVAELNLGQYRLEIERLASDEVEVIGVHRLDGELIRPDEILERGNMH